MVFRSAVLSAFGMCGATTAKAIAHRANALQLGLRATGIAASSVAPLSAFASRSRFFHSTPAAFTDEQSSPAESSDSDGSSSNSSNSNEQSSPRSFNDFKIDNRLRQALMQDLKYEYASPIQDLCFNPCNQGNDVILKSKTGTGKTIAFLLPIIQRHFREARRTVKLRPSRVPVLVIAPTRELAKQAEDEGAKLLKRLPRELGTDCCIGGTPRGTSMKRMHRRRPFILSATPGRLLDMMETAGWHDLFKDLKVLVLDEADRLLDMGFRSELEAIIAKLNEGNTDRQTILLSATYPDDVQSLTNIACVASKPPVIVDVPDANSNNETASSVAQYHHEVAMNDLVPALHTIIHNHIEECRVTKQKPKIMAFFNTTAQAQFFSEVFEREKHAYNLYTIHSRMNQSKRDRIRGTFKRVKTGVLFTTDVSARGVDYPNVTLVIQFGIPRDRDTYIHRVGRTGRGHNLGSAILLTTPEERPFVTRELKNIDMEKVELQMLPSSDGDDEEEGGDGDFYKNSRDFVNQRYSFLREYNDNHGEETFHSFLGYYRGFMSDLNMAPSDLLSYADSYSKGCLMLPSAPRISRDSLQRMGLLTKATSGSKHSHNKNRRSRFGVPKPWGGPRSRARQQRSPSRYNSQNRNSKY